MARRFDHIAQHLSHATRTAFLGPQLFAFVPALMLFGYWYGGEAALIVCAIAFPVLVTLVWLFSFAPRRTFSQDIGRVGMPTRKRLAQHLDKVTETTLADGRRSIIFALEIDDLDQTTRDHGQSAGEELLHSISTRLEGVLRADDTLGMLDEGRFGLILAPTHAASLETAIQVASRLQKTLETPVDLGGLRLYTSLTIGFCIPTRSEARSGAAQLAAAEAALADALGAGRAAIRAYSPGKSRTRVARTGLVTEVEAALEQGHIVPWFQPQLSTDTGQVSGVEALARWRHPKHGLISPGAFLPAISAAGLSCRLSEIILYHALAAQRAWDEAGLHVPTVGVNFSSEDLNDPHLFDKVQWELDRFQLTPDRLAVEILETVISQSENDVITRNITRLGEFGCHIDLDDFGTGHSSLANVRRFRVNRIKIDRSFVTQIDSDRQQQQMLAAILELANRLRIETLAEGVESSGEHTMLAQLGCAHVQGYHIAKPLPFDDATSWLKRQAKTQTSFPGLPKQSGT